MPNKGVILPDEALLYLFDTFAESTRDWQKKMKKVSNIRWHPHKSAE